MSVISFSAYRLVNSQFSWASGLEDMGYDGWEIVSEGKQKITPETLPEIRDIISTANLRITVHGPFSDLNLAALNDPTWNETVRQIKQCVELSADFTDTVVVHPGALSPLDSQMKDQAWDRNIEALRVLAAHAEEHGVRLCLENMPNMEKLLCRTPDELFGMVETIGSDSLGTTLDIGHANTTKNIPAFLKHAERINHVHVHDNKGTADEHLAVGDGTADWSKVFKGLKDYNGALVVEGRTLEEGRRSLEFVKKQKAKSQ